MDADLGILAIELYVRTDDLLKDFPGHRLRRPAAGIGLKVSDAELVTPGGDAGAAGLRQCQ